MAVLSALLPSTVAFRGIAALRLKQRQLSRKWQRAKAEREQIFRITQDLKRCSDRHLADLGLSRADIPDVARGTYRRG